MRIKPFRGYRPVKEKIAAVASRPYDALSSAEARIEARGNPDSFLNVVKPEITLPEGTDPYGEAVYGAAAANFQKLIDNGTFFRDRQACLYLYELTRAGRSQTGIVAAAAVDDYLNGKIKKHESTRPDKENDRRKHILTTMMDAEPVMFAYRRNNALDSIAANVRGREPEYDFTLEDGVTHRFWVINDAGMIADIVACFAQMDATYVADGHHRTAASGSVGRELRQGNGEQGSDYFLAAHFPDEQLEILDYNRVVTDLNGHDAGSFLNAIAESFSIEKVSDEQVKPARRHEIGMYLQGGWYRLIAKEHTYNDDDPVDALDVTILSESILKPVLNIHDLRTDQRIGFVGGIRGLDELERRVNSGEMMIAFAMYPVSMEQLMTIADEDRIMPPKVTWFEPKLRSGLVVYSLKH